VQTADQLGGVQMPNQLSKIQTPNQMSKLQTPNQMSKLRTPNQMMPVRFFSCGLDPPFRGFLHLYEFNKLICIGGLLQLVAWICSVNSLHDLFILSLRVEI
jgi:hypothetical protein